jgi:hypothetical protein
MTRLREVANVSMSSAECERYLPQYFVSSDTERQIRMPLRISLRDFGLPDAQAIERDVEVRVNKTRDEQNLNDEFAVTWEPVDGGPFPSFSGRLRVWGEDDPNASFIELDGSYQPPLGAFGVAFDATVGRSIAERTAREFLRLLSARLTALKSRATVL